MNYGIFSCSPRAGGNSDFCASLIRANLQESTIFYPARAVLQPCIACGYCETNPGRCAFCLQSEDTAGRLYQELFKLDRAFFIVPVYFYHVPAMLKAFLDRAQAWYFLPKEQKPAKNLRIKLILIGAREQGQKLFEGVGLTMKYAMQSIGAETEASLCLYGLDKPGDLAGNPEKQQKILVFIC